MTDAAILPGAPPHAWAIENESALNAGAPTAVARLRREAAARAAEIGVPTPRHEAWKYTSLAALSRSAWTPAAGTPSGMPRRLLPGLPQLQALPGVWRLVLVGGRVSSELSQLAATSGSSLSASVPSGVRVLPLAQALAHDAPRVLATLGHIAPFADDYVTALNTAFLDDGVWVEVDPGAQITETLHIVHIAVADTVAPMTHARVLITAGAGSRLTVCEQFLSVGSDAAFTTGVTEIDCGANSAVDHVRIQSENTATFHLGVVRARQARDSHLTSHVFSWGAALARVDVSSQLAEPGAEATFNGLYLGGGAQHVDHQTTLDHVAPHCTSAQTYRGVLGGSAHGVFNGAVIVRADAQKTDARQTNKNLLLSSTATIDTKPQLEIFANDVKCTHGATVGALDEQALFFLRARGIARRPAETMLTVAFAQDVVARVRDAALRTWLETQVENALHTLGLERGEA